MTDWLDWLLGELEEKEDQGEDLDLSPHALPRRQAEEETEREDAGEGPAPARYGGDAGPNGPADGLPKGADTTAERQETKGEGEKSYAEENGESGSLSLPLAVKLERTQALSRAARSIGTEPERLWQEGTPAGTGDVRTAESGRRESWLPAGGTQLRTESNPADSLGRTASAQGDGYLYAAVQGGEYLYTAARRARAAVEQARGLQQAGPVVIREPAAVGGKWPTPTELDRIFQRDARRYDGGFTLF